MLSEFSRISGAAGPESINAFVQQRTGLLVNTSKPVRCWTNALMDSRASRAGSPRELGQHLYVPRAHKRLANSISVQMCEAL